MVIDVSHRWNGCSGVSRVCSACDAASGKSREAYDKVHVQLKLHVIEAHLPTFVRKWRTSGLFVEDACESIHNVVNTLNRRYACLHGEAKGRSKAAALDTSRGLTSSNSRS
mmetsp:Transcript_19505/g.60226  ORF Transcript_19505/g.60226 Transcript_19505/m.60226 type:complete len:111 (-) Transcript_19505:1056-1388(-)